MKPRHVPYFFAGLILISPAISLALMFVLTWLGGGCRVHEGFPQPCVIAWIDFGNIVYNLGLWGAWGFFFSWFVAGAFCIPWLVIHMVIEISERAKKRAANAAKAKKAVELVVHTQPTRAVQAKSPIDSVVQVRAPTEFQPKSVDPVARSGRPTRHWRVPIPRTSMQWIGVLAALPLVMTVIQVVVVYRLAGCTSTHACLQSDSFVVRGFILLQIVSVSLWLVCLIWLPILLFRRRRAKTSKES